MSVLIVDDNPSNVALLMAVLADEGLVRISAETDSRKVAGLLASVNPDLVLLDLHMPHLDGHAVLDQVVQFAAGSFLPVLVLTADVTRPVRDRALSRGAQDFLSKPFDTTEVVLRIANLLKTRQLYSTLRQLAGTDDEAATPSVARRDAILAVQRDHSITPVFQPIVELRNRDVVGHEALSRFPTPHDQGPAGWFGDAFELGLGVDLEWQAITAAVPFLHATAPETFLALNLSPASMLEFGHRELCPPSLWPRVVLELTEHVPIEDYSALHRSTQTFRDAGGRIAVDDAGAGYAGFRHLIALGADIIKLDISLVRGIDHNHAARALTRALLAFAADVGAVILAEGIETENELTVLQDLGVPWGQGYHLGRPAAPDKPLQSPRPARTPVTGLPHIPSQKPHRALTPSSAAPRTSDEPIVDHGVVEPA